jgi:hypothetical protein
MLWGLGRCPGRIGALPEKLVGSGGAIHAGLRRPPSSSRGSVGSSGSGGSSSSPVIRGRGGARAFAPVYADEPRAGSPVRQPARLPAPVRCLVREGQPAGAPHDPGRARRATGRGARADAASARPAAGSRSSVRGAGAGALCAVGSQRPHHRPAVRGRSRRDADLPGARHRLMARSSELARLFRALKAPAAARATITAVRDGSRRPGSPFARRLRSSVSPSSAA